MYRWAPDSGRVDLRAARVGWGMQLIFLLSTLVGSLALSALMYNVLNGAFGLRAVEYKNPPEALAVNGVPLDDLTKDELVGVLQANVSQRRLQQARWGEALC